MKMKHREYDFVTEYDVVVAGGGLAGVAAALASARRGLRTCLVEKTIFTGGLATTGCILFYLPLSDSRGQQVTFGISEELLLASIKYGPGDVPDWKNDPKHRYGVRFNPASFILALDEILENAGIDMWYDTVICEAEMEGNKVIGAVVENKSGRGVIKANAFADATGDADLAHRAGAACAVQGNYLSIWGMGYSLDIAKQAVKDNCGDALAQLIGYGSSDSGHGQPEGQRLLSGVDGKDVSEFVVRSRKLALDSFKQLQAEKGVNGRKDVFPAMLPAMCNFRTTRRIEGMLTIKTGDEFKHYEDCVGVVADWRGGNDVWELPYRSMLPVNVKGILAAGRCLASAGEAWSVMRVIQAAAMSGEVAGLAASMSAERGITPDSLSVKDLHSELKKRGFMLDMRELAKLPREVVKA